MTTEEETYTVQQVIDFLRAEVDKNPREAMKLRSICSSFARVYRETAKPGETWTDIEVNRDDLERRLKHFAIKMRPRFKSPELTLPSYNSRTRRAVDLYEEKLEPYKTAQGQIAHSLDSSHEQKHEQSMPFCTSPEVSFTVEQIKRQVEIIERYLEFLSAIIEQNTKSQKGGNM